MNMDIQNFVPFDCGDDEHRYYMIIDSKKCFADQCFDRKQLDVQYRNEFGAGRSKYIIRECRVRRDDEQDFEAAMRELMVVMHVEGYDDYRKACDALAPDAALLAESPVVMNS